MNNTSPLRIPYELLRTIFEHLKNDKPSLCAVSLCTSTFRQEAQRILFQDVSAPMIRPRKNLSFLQTVATSPNRLALLVRAYRISWDKTSSDHPFTVCNGLKAMINLKHLRVDVEYDLESPEESAAVSMLHGCSFKLDHLDWNSGNRDARELIETFLPLQDGLDHLGIYISDVGSLEPAPNLLADSILCPRLFSLEGTWSAIKVLLPGRKITTLTVLPSLFPREDSDEEITPLVPALQCLEVLSYHSFQFDRQDPESILRHCTSLKVLEFHNFSFFATNAFHMVPQVPSLHTLIITEDDQFEDPTPALGLRIRSIFDNHSTNLQCIAVQVGVDRFVTLARQGK